MIDHDAMVANILDFYSRATAAERHDGREWYGAALEAARNISARTGVELPVVAAVVAVLSPQTEWEHNLRWASEVVEAWTKGERLPSRGLGNSLRRARIALSGDLSDVYRRASTRKVHNFYLCILGMRGAVTIDRHAIRVALGDSEAAVPGITDGQYDAVATAYREAARRLRIGVRHLQAITWLVAKREREALAAA